MLALYLLGIDETDAEDLVQETALEIARSSALIASPEDYAFQVFHNRCARFLDRRIKRSRRSSCRPRRVNENARPT